MIIKRILARPALGVGVAIVLGFLAISIAAPLIAPPAEGDAESPYIIPKTGLGIVPRPPSAEHPLGLMAQQCDVLYGLVWGTRAAFQVGLIVTLGRLFIGLLLGLISGYAGGLMDAVLMRITDAFLAFPIVAAAMVMVVLFGRELQTLYAGLVFLVPSREEQVIMVTLVVFGWMSYARLVRGNVLSEREKDYVQAARASGVRSWRIMLRHLLPNITQGLFVLTASDVGAVVILVTVFSFIGLIQPAAGQMKADWGQMLSAARDWIITPPASAFAYWYTYVPVSAAVVLFSVGWNLIGDGLRDVFDPRLRHRFAVLRKNR
jgi:peptide/nickel transport system permease protein